MRRASATAIATAQEPRLDSGTGEVSSERSAVPICSRSRVTQNIENRMPKSKATPLSEKDT